MGMLRVCLGGHFKSEILHYICYICHTSFGLDVHKGDVKERCAPGEGLFHTRADDAVLHV